MNVLGPRTGHKIYIFSILFIYSQLILVDFFFSNVTLLNSHETSKLRCLRK